MLSIVEAQGIRGYKALFYEKYSSFDSCFSCHSFTDWMSKW